MDLREFSRQLEGHRRDSRESDDAALRNDCIHLLGRIECHVDQFSAKIASHDLYGQLETLKVMLVEILDFIRQRFGNDATAACVPRICELRDTVNDLQQLVSRGFWSTLLRRKATPDQLQLQACRQAGSEFADLFQELLSVIDEQFHAPERAAEWRSSYRVLIEEFRERW